MTKKLSYFLEFWNETCRKWSLGIDAGTEYVYFGFRHQGAELFSAKGRKIGVLTALQPFTGMYRDLTGIRVDRDGFITVIDSIPAMTVVAELQLTGIICNTNRKFNILCCPQVNPC